MADTAGQCVARSLTGCYGRHRRYEGERVPVVGFKNIKTGKYLAIKKGKITSGGASGMPRSSWPRCMASTAGQCGTL